MTVVPVVICNARPGTCEQRWPAVRAHSVGAARARAAVHGWSTVERRGVVLDVCPACAAVELASVRAALAARGLPGLGLAAGEHPAPRHQVVLVGDDVEVCSWCEAGDHTWCTGCECPSAAHQRAAART